MSTLGRALRIEAPRQFAIIEQEAPEPKPDEILIELRACATCTNWELQTWRGTDIFGRPGYPVYPQSPGSPGHEAAGVVIEVGSEVTDLAVGDHVAIYGSMRGPENDAHATHVTRPASEVALLDPTIPFSTAAPLEMAMCALRSLELAGPLAGVSVAIVGLGPAGILHLQVAKALGAARVIGLDVVEARLEAARPFADAVADSRDEAAVAEIARDGVELAFDCSGSGPGMALGLSLARRVMHMFAVPNATVAWGREQWVRSVAIEPYHWRGDTQPACLRRAAKLLAERRIEPDAIVTDVMPYSAYAEGLRKLEAMEAIKVVFEWE
jgi:threonine dehydrogenase-like Zn-dependent dehydrogenase